MNSQRFFLYLLRWQLSTLILAPCLYFLGGLGEWPATIVANLIGGCVFYLVDSKIFKEAKHDKNK